MKNLQKSKYGLLKLMFLNEFFCNISCFLLQNNMAEILTIYYAVPEYPHTFRVQCFKVFLITKNYPSTKPFKRIPCREIPKLAFLPPLM